MPTITLPDGAERHYEQSVDVATVAGDISPGLARAAVAGKVNDELVDTSFLVEEDVRLAIVTAKDPEGVEVIRHSAAHLLAQAVKQLFPSAQVTIGPVIEAGFYYDFAYERAFTPEDLEAIEGRMKELAKQKQVVTREVHSRDEVVALFQAMGEIYKVDIIKAIPADETLSLYRQGDFVDLCRGPHVPHTGFLKAFKLTKLAGAYWRGDSNNEMLQRIYGTAWGDKAALTDYLHRLAEAEKRDHRRIGKVQDLFHTQEESPGMVYWHDKGWSIYQTIAQYLRRVQREHGYQEVCTPQFADRSLWERSGHWDKFGEFMFTTESENRDFAVKPMNCPGHIQIFNQGLKSYRDLPLRMAEFGSCHRNEPSGTLHGLMRVRHFVQDDAHIFCTQEQVQEEVASFIELLRRVYRDFGFDNILIKLSTRPELRVGDDALWDRAERDLEQALKATGLEWEVLPGEGAFYGPKIEFSLKDCLERVWQCGTMQLDYNLPQRLDAQYVSENSSRQIPVMLHRAILGSFERFIGILIEHYAGSLPLWLAPVQAVLLNITDKQSDYVLKMEELLRKAGFRVHADLRNEKIGFKIRHHTLQRVPYLLVVGDRELESQTIAVRTLQGEDLGAMSPDALVARLRKERELRGQVAE